MRLYILLGLLLLVPASLAFAHGGRSTEFGSYPSVVEKRTAKAIDFRRSPGASSFRTRLRQAIKGEVNFAGRYIIAGWGCGKSCSHSAIIDAKTGRVHFPEELLGVSVWFGDLADDYEVYTYRKDSRLLIVRGTPGPMKDGDSNQEQGTYHYEWRANRLRLVRFVPADRPS